MESFRLSRLNSHDFIQGLLEPLDIEVTIVVVLPMPYMMDAYSGAGSNVI